MNNFQNDVVFAINPQNFVAVLEIKIPRRIWHYRVNMRLELLNLDFRFHRCFENENHAVANVGNKLARAS